MNQTEFKSYVNSVGYREDEATFNIPSEFIEKCVNGIEQKCGYETLFVVAFGYGATHYRSFPLKEVAGCNG